MTLKDAKDLFEEFVDYYFKKIVVDRYERIVYKYNMRIKEIVVAGSILPVV